MNKKNTSKVLHITLWIAQALLAAVFAMAGFMKVFAPIEQLAQNGMGFVENFGTGMVRFIGCSEVLGAIGLILPAALRVKPALTPIAAAALALVMVLASAYHISHNEPFSTTVVLFLLAVFVAWGRLKKSPITAKS